ncbi:MAG: Mur ligase family protein [Eubacteriales bacterium]
MQKIGIMGTHGKTSILYILEALFCYCKKNVGIIGDYGVRINKNKISHRDRTMLELIIEMEENEIDFLIIELHDYHSVRDIPLDCIIFGNSSHDSINHDFYKEMMRLCKVIIVNGDDEEVLHIIKGLENAYIITYGLKNKNTITASSLSCMHDKMVFNYYIQRGFISFGENEIIVQEIPIELHLISYQHIYNSLAAITTGIFFDLYVDALFMGLKALTSIPNRLELLSSQRFSILIDNATKIVTLKVIFETLQYLAYKKMMLGIHAQNLKELLFSSNINELIEEFNSNHIGELNIIGQCHINIDKKLINTFSHELNKHHIAVNHYHYFHEYIEKVFFTLNSDDLFLWIGSRKMLTENKEINI